MVEGARMASLCLRDWSWKSVAPFNHRRGRARGYVRAHGRALASGGARPRACDARAGASHGLASSRPSASCRRRIDGPPPGSVHAPLAKGVRGLAGSRQEYIIHGETRGRPKDARLGDGGRRRPGGGWARELAPGSSAPGVSGRSQTGTPAAPVRTSAASPRRRGRRAQ